MATDTVEERYMRGEPHDPRSVALFEAIRKIDYENSDYFQWEAGGDGDNGEELMYLLDIYYTEMDVLFDDLGEGL